MVSVRSKSGDGTSVLCAVELCVLVLRGGGGQSSSSSSLFNLLLLPLPFKGTVHNLDTDPRFPHTLRHRQHLLVLTWTALAWCIWR